MTTSPFGTPVQPDPAPAPAAAPVTKSRKPLLFALGGVAAVAAVGAGAFFLLGPDGEDVAEAPVTRGQGATPVPSAEPTPTVTPVPDVTLSSRNPFAAQVVAGGQGAAATAPESGASSGSSSSGSSGAGSGSGSGSGSSGSSGGGTTAVVEGAAGPAGPAGPAGKNGKDGRNGANGADGLTPLFVTIQVVDVDEATNTVDAVVRTTGGETTPIDLPVGSPFDADPETVAGQVVYKAVGADTSAPADGQIDFVTITVNGVDYTTQVGETFLGFVYQ